MPTKRAILDELTRDELRTSIDSYELPVADRRVRAHFVDALARSRKARLDKILHDLSRERLKELCRAFDLDDSSPRKADLTARLLGQAAVSARRESSAVRAPGSHPLTQPPCTALMCTGDQCASLSPEFASDCSLRYRMCRREWLGHRGPSSSAYCSWSRPKRQLRPTSTRAPGVCCYRCCWEESPLRGWSRDCSGTASPRRFGEGSRPTRNSRHPDRHGRSGGQGVRGRVVPRSGRAGVSTGRVDSPAPHRGSPARLGVPFLQEVLPNPC